MQKESQSIICYSLYQVILPCIGRWHSLSEKEAISRRKLVEGRYFSFPRHINLRYFAESKSDFVTLAVSLLLIIIIS